MPRWDGKAGGIFAGLSILVTGASPASPDDFDRGSGPFLGRVANCVSDEMIGKATALPLCAIEGSDST